MQWDAVYSISDLHLGGEKPDPQIFTQGELLRDACVELGERAHGTRFALVVNGDIVDFLAESRDGQRYFFGTGAAKRLDELAARPEFAPVFDGWTRLLKAGGTLVFLVGNHDIELRLPSCQRWFEGKLAGSDAALRQRIVWSMDGVGYSCNVGGSSVHLVHGNDWDAWNKVDHQAVGQAAADEEQGRTPKAVPPNDGTRLVIDVMNPIKASYHFVDRLKPEGATLAALLAAVDLGTFKHLGGFLRTGAGYLWERLKRPWLLAGEAEGSGIATPVSPPATDEEAIRRLLSEASRARSRPAATLDLMLRVELDHRANRRSLDYSSSIGEGEEMLSGAGAWTLRNLLWLLLNNANEEAFQHTKEDEYYQAACRMAPPVDFMVIGHTHLRRALKMPSGAAYFNSGTWIDLLAVPDKALVHTVETEKLEKALKNNRLEEYTRRYPTIVAIERSRSGRTSGRLLEAVKSSGGAALEEVKDSELTPKRRPS